MLREEKGETVLDLIYPERLKKKKEGFFGGGRSEEKGAIGA